MIEALQKAILGSEKEMIFSFFFFYFEKSILSSTSVFGVKDFPSIKRI